MDQKELYQIAKGMLEKSYAPFSKFCVGAALVGKSGKVYTGCNVENSSYGGTICAERTAFTKAVSEGEREFTEIMILSGEGAVWPCGICRQFMKEFCEDDFLILTGDSEDSIEEMTMGEILPKGFKL